MKNWENWRQSISGNLSESHPTQKQVLHSASHFIAEMDYSALEYAWCSEASPCPRIETHGRAPPTGTIENYRRSWRWKGRPKTTMVLGCQARLQRGFLFIRALPRTPRVNTIKWRPWPQLNDAWPRVHGQVVVIIVQVVKNALFHQRLVDGFLVDSFEIFPGLLLQVNFLIFYLPG